MKQGIKSLFLTRSGFFVLSIVSIAVFVVCSAFFSSASAASMFGSFVFAACFSAIAEFWFICRYERVAAGWKRFVFGAIFSLLCIGVYASFAAPEFAVSNTELINFRTFTFPAFFVGISALVSNYMNYQKKRRMETVTYYVN